MPPSAWYSSVLMSSDSFPLRSIPMCHVQLWRTDFRSLAPAAGVNAVPRPPRPGPPGPGPPRPCAPAAGAAGACPQAVTPLIATRTASTPIARDRRSTMANSQGIPSVAAVAEEELDVAVAELEIPDESRRVPVPRRKDRHLEDLARLHGGLVDSLPGQRRYGGGGQLPLRERAIR